MVDMKQQSQYSCTVHLVMALSGIAVCGAISSLILDTWSLGMLGSAGAAYGGRENWGAWYACISAVGIALCGWFGACYKNSKMLCVFGSCNYCAGCVDCIVMMLLTILLFVCMALAAFVSDCKLAVSPTFTTEAPDSTTPFHREYIDAAGNGTQFGDRCGSEDNKKAMLGFCYAMQNNFTDGAMSYPENMTQAEVDAAIDTTACTEQLYMITSVVVILIGVGMFLRCCTCCFHSVSGFYAFKLKRLVDNGEVLSDSESGSDNE